MTVHHASRPTAPPTAPAPVAVRAAVTGPVARRSPRALLSPLRLLFAVLVVLVFVSPIYLTIVNAFKTQDAIVANPAAPPVHPTLSNLTTALNRPDQLVQLGLRNSLIVVSCSVLLLIPLGAAFSFYISRRRTRLRAAVLALLAAGLMIPLRWCCCRRSTS